MIYILLFLSVASFSQSINTFRKKLQTYEQLADDFIKNGNIDSALFYFEKAITISTNLSDSLRLTVLLRKVGAAYELSGQNILSMISYSKAINNSKYTNQMHEEGICNLGLSNINFRMANYEQALTNGILAARIFEEIKDSVYNITASMMIVQIYIALKKYEKALVICNEMLKISKNVGDNSKIADVLGKIGVIHFFKKEYNKSLHYYFETLEINKKLSDSINIAISLANIGEVYMFENEYLEAIKQLNKALEIVERNSYNSVAIFVYYTLGETYSKMGDKKLAVEFFNKSLKLVIELDEKREESHVLRLLSMYYESIGNFEKSLSYYKKSNSIKDSLRNALAGYRLEEIRVKYEIEKRDAELETILFEKELQERKIAIDKHTIKLQFVIIILVFIGLISSIFFTYYVFRNQRKLKKANRTKDVLFSVIGHDLKGPIGSVKQIVSLLQDPSVKDRDKLIGLLEKPIISSYNLLEDLLVWSRSVKGIKAYNPRTVHLVGIIDRVFKLFEKQAENKNIFMHHSISADLEIFADENQVYTILRNLVSNAIKFTLSGGNIEITSEKHEKEIKVHVIDTGVGIEPKNLE